jgi:predicted Zn-dependent peptidase
MHARQSISLGVWIKVGGRYESKVNKGIAHFLEHLLFKGSKKYSCRKIKESIEGVGGSLNGFTSEELTCYLVKIPSCYLELALDILADMVVNPLLSLPEIEKEKTVILEEIKMYKDLPQSYVNELLDGLLWPNQPLGLPVIGTVDSVNSICKQELSLFQKRYYIPSNIVVSAAGLLEYDKLIRYAREAFPETQLQQAHRFPAVRLEQNAPRLKVLDKDTEQTHLALGFNSFRRDHPLRHALGILHIILGANMSSRLFNELREKRGLAYEIGTQLRYFHDTGSLNVHAGIDNQKVVDALSLILKEFNKTKVKLVKPDEFRRAKEFYVGQLMLSLEDTLDHMLWIGESTATLDKTYSLQDIIREVDRVTREDIRIAARQVLEEKKINLALIGPLQGRQERISDCLGLA